MMPTGGIASFYTPDDMGYVTIQSNNKLTKKEIEDSVNKAISLMKKSVSINPDIKEAYFYIAIAYLRILKTNDAIDYFYKSIEIENNREDSYIFLSGLLCDQGSYDKALEVAKLFLVRFPNKVAMGNFLIGQVYFKKKDYRQAIMVGKKILQAEKNNIKGRFLLAHSYYMLNDFEKANKEFNEVIRIKPELSKDIEGIKRSLDENR